MSVQEARNTWDRIINEEIYDNKSKGLEENNQDRTKESPKEDNIQRNDIGELREAQNEIKDQGEAGRSMEEVGLLKKLSSGELDGQVGKDYYTTGGSTIWTEIKDGNPIRYKQGPGGKLFDGKEGVKFEGVKHTLEEWKTDDEKLAFLQKYGWLIEDDDVKNYSKKFKPEN